MSAPFRTAPSAHASAMAMRNAASPQPQPPSRDVPVPLCTLAAGCVPKGLALMPKARRACDANTPHSVCRTRLRRCNACLCHPVQVTYAFMVTPRRAFAATSRFGVLELVYERECVYTRHAQCSFATCASMQSELTVQHAACAAAACTVFHKARCPSQIVCCMHVIPSWPVHHRALIANCATGPCAVRIIVWHCSPHPARDHAYDWVPSYRRH